MGHGTHLELSEDNKFLDERLKHSKSESRCESTGRKKFILPHQHPSDYTFYVQEYIVEIHLPKEDPTVKYTCCNIKL
jgi:hypothetical protein